MKGPNLKPTTGAKTMVLEIAATALLSANLGPALAQSWVRTSAPELFWFGVASSAGGSRLVAVANQGYIYTSTNSGGDWKASYNLINASAVASSADGRVLVVVHSGANVLVSTNSGGGWRPSSTRPSGSVQSIVSSVDGSRLVAIAGGSSPGRIYVSTDSGMNWSVTSAPLTNWSAVASSADGGKLVATVGTYAAGPIYTSSNSGLSWSPTSAPIASWHAVASSVDGNKLVAADRNSQRIYTSTNAGTSWTATSAPLRNWWSVASSADGSKLVATVWQGPLYTSSNSGASWTPATVPNAQWISVASSADGNKLVAVINGGGIETWQSASQSIPTLTLTRSGGSAVLSWPLYAADYSLQQNTSLAATSWTDAEAIPTFTDQECRVEVSPIIGSQFYRLQGF